MPRRASREKIVGRFIALPHQVIDTREQAALPHAARSLLILIARQYSGRNNGRLVATPKYLERYGWRSHNSTTRCLRQLSDAGLIIQTRIGTRPNRAAWYAITWQSLDHDREMDIEARQFRRFSGTPLSPTTGIARTGIAPAMGIRTSPSIPTTGAMRADLGAALSPSRGSI